MNVRDLEQARNLLVNCGCMTEIMADEVGTRIRQLAAAAALLQPPAESEPDDEDPEITG